MAIAALVPALRLELDDAQLGAALVGENTGRDGGVAKGVAVEHVVAVDDEQRRQFEGVSVGHGQALDQEGLALLDAVLLATGFDNRVHGQSDSDDDEAELAVAPERRRPPLRPRRRGFDSRSSEPVSDPSPSADPAPPPPLAPPPPPPPPPPTSTNDATAAVRPTSSMRTTCFSPT